MWNSHEILHTSYCYAGADTSADLITCMCCNASATIAQSISQRNHGCVCHSFATTQTHSHVLNSVVMRSATSERTHSHSFAENTYTSTIVVLFSGSDNHCCFCQYSQSSCCGQCSHSVHSCDEFTSCWACNGRGCGHTSCCRCWNCEARAGRVGGGGGGTPQFCGS